MKVTAAMAARALRKNFENVFSVTWGPAVRQSRAGDGMVDFRQIGLVAVVTHKVSPDELHADERIPRRWYGFDVDVLEIGELKAVPAAAGINPHPHSRAAMASAPFAGLPVGRFGQNGTGTCGGWVAPGLLASNFHVFGSAQRVRAHGREHPAPTAWVNGGGRVTPLGDVSHSWDVLPTVESARCWTFSTRVRNTRCLNKVDLSVVDARDGDWGGHADDGNYPRWRRAPVGVWLRFASWRLALADAAAHGATVDAHGMGWNAVKVLAHNVVAPVQMGGGRVSKFLCDVVSYGLMSGCSGSMERGNNGRGSGTQFFAGADPLPQRGFRGIGLVIPGDRVGQALWEWRGRVGAG